MRVLAAKLDGYSTDYEEQAILPEAQAAHENQQFALYSLMLLAPLKDPAAKVTEQPVGADGTRAIKATLPNGLGGELEFVDGGTLAHALSGRRKM